MKHLSSGSTEHLALRTFTKLMRASNRLSGDCHRHLQQDNLTHSQFGVLEALYHLGPLCQGELGSKILKSNANLTMVVDSLENKQLVNRERSETDRRQVRVSLTPAGEQLIVRVFPRHAAVIEDELSILSAEEQEQLGVLLKKLGQGRNRP